jgi:hypothetical protein
VYSWRRIRLGAARSGNSIAVANSTRFAGTGAHRRRDGHIGSGNSLPFGPGFSDRAHLAGHKPAIFTSSGLTATPTSLIRWVLLVCKLAQTILYTEKSGRQRASAGSHMHVPRFVRTAAYAPVWQWTVTVARWARVPIGSVKPTTPVGFRGTWPGCGVRFSDLQEPNDQDCGSSPQLPAGRRDDWPRSTPSGSDRRPGRAARG